jgi:uncharacterized FlaG/YvyC family protein
MDISKLRGISPSNTALVKSDVRKNNSANTDRDADGRESAGHQRNQIKQLSPEQEQEAVAKLNALSAFRTAGLVARIVREAGKAPHVVVSNSKGETVRHMPYQQLIDLYLDRNSDVQSGRLLKRAA